MNEPQDDERLIENQLADFTDNILIDLEPAREDKASFSQDPELRALEQTALHLRNAFHEGSPSEAVIQRMRRNIAIRTQQQESKESEPFWKKWTLMLNPSKRKWQSQYSRQRLGMAISLAILIALILISAPLLKGVSPDQPATSGQILDPGLLIASGGLLLLLVFLLFRRKQ